MDEVRSAVRSCVENRLGLMPIGGGTRTHIGHPSTKELCSLSTVNLNRITEHVPQDLVICAESGITLSALQEQLKPAGQWLPIDVANPEKQSLGGIVSSKVSSTLRPGFGSVRDWLIGVEVVNSGAEIVIGGGKVVKNVSGYDLPKLYCGSWGTLGVITKTNFKVSPLPECDRSMLVVLSPGRNAEELLDNILSQISPASATLFNAHAAARILGPGCAPVQYLMLRFLGLEEDVEASSAAATAIASPFSVSVTQLPEQLGRELFRALTDFANAEAPLAATYHILSSQVGAYCRMIDWIATRHGLIAEVVADASCGIVSAHFFERDGPVDWPSFIPLFRDKADRVAGSLIVERMPESWREAGVDVWSPILPDFRIMQLLKQQLDPENVFNPGRFMGGI